MRNHLGPGFIESVYERALIQGLKSKGLHVEIQKPIQIIYKGKNIGIHRVDLVVEGKIVVGLKTVDRISIHHKAQLTSYLKASGLKLGILVNFCFVA